MVENKLTAIHHGLTFIALVVLATVSLVLGTAGFGPAWGLVLGMAIATVKALLVLAVFMHMAEQPFRTRVGLGISVGLLLVLVALTVGDVATRDVLPPAPLPPPAEAFYEGY